MRSWKDPMDADDVRMIMRSKDIRIIIPIDVTDNQVDELLKCLDRTAQHELPKYRDIVRDWLSKIGS